MADFASQIKAFAEQTQTKLNTAVRAAVLQVGASVVNLSPVGDDSHWKEKPKDFAGGLFKGNWQYGLGSAPDGVFDTIDPSGQASLQRIAEAIPADAAGGVHYIVNNLPYAQALEDGTSTTPPAGMVALTAAQWGDMVGKAAGDGGGDGQQS